MDIGGDEIGGEICDKARRPLVPKDGAMGSLYVWVPVSPKRRLGAILALARVRCGDEKRSAHPLFITFFNALCILRGVPRDRAPRAMLLCHGLLRLKDLTFCRKYDWAEAVECPHRVVRFEC